MKKVFSFLVVIALIFLPLKMSSQNSKPNNATETLDKIFSSNTTKGEISGKIIQSNLVDKSAENKFFVIGTDTIYIDSQTKLQADLPSPKRLHVFYSKNPANKKIATLIEQEDFITPELKFYLPIPGYIWATAISNIETPAQYKDAYGNVTMWGYGVGADAHVYKGIRVFADCNFFTYEQEITEKGGIAHHSIGTGGTITLADGAKYSTYTGSLRLGVKYTFLREKPYQPWIGLAYGVNLWNVKYISWDGDKIYGKASGLTLRSSIMAGIDFKINKLGTITFFFDAISPVADYTMKNLFGVGDYSQFDGVTYPTPRIGLAIGY